MRQTWRVVICCMAVAAMGVLLSIDAASAQEAAPASKAPRIVAPQLIAPPDVGPSDLQRIEPRPPLDGTLQVLPGQEEPAAKPRPTLGRKLLKADPLLFKPVAEQAGVIKAEGRTVTLAGIEPLPLDETCGQDAGTPWPCGMIARTSFRNFLRGRAVRCEFPDGEVPEEVTVACRLGNRDLGEWLVANGWARTADDTYKDQAKAAEEAKRGVYGAAPRGLAASLRNNGGATSAPANLPSGSLSILPTEADPSPDTAAGAQPESATPQVVTPQVAPVETPAIQSAPLPPPSQPKLQ